MRVKLRSKISHNVLIAILALIGWYFGHLAGNMTALEMVNRGKELLHQHYGWILLFLVLFTAGYLLVQHLVMRSGKKDAAE